MQMLVFRAKIKGYKLDTVADALRADAQGRFGNDIPGAFEKAKATGKKLKILPKER